MSIITRGGKKLVITPNGNSHSLQLYLDHELPMHANGLLLDVVHEWVKLDNSTLYAGEYKNRFVSYLIHNPANERGYGGAEVRIPCTDGDHLVKGPWSSRVSCVNKVFWLYPQCIDARVYTPKGGEFCPHTLGVSVKWLFETFDVECGVHREDATDIIYTPAY